MTMPILSTSRKIKNRFYFILDLGTDEVRIRVTSREGLGEGAGGLGNFKKPNLKQESDSRNIFVVIEISLPRPILLSVFVLFLIY